MQVFRCHSNRENPRLKVENDRRRMSLASASPDHSRLDPPLCPFNRSMKNILLPQPLLRALNVRSQVVVPYKTPVTIEVFAKTFEVNPTRSVTLVDVASARATRQHGVRAWLTNQRISLKYQLTEEFMFCEYYL